MDKQQPKDQASNKGGLWQYQVPPQDSGAGAGASNAGHYAGGAHGGDSQQGDFLPSAPDANAMPAGAPQTSRGSAGQPETGSGGTRGDTGAAGGGGDSGAGSGSLGGAGAGAGKTPGTPGGNGTKDEPIWGS